MNIKIITRHSPSNYGSLLQSIATQHVLSQLGYDNEIIDYERPDERGLAGVLTQLKQKQGYGNPLKRLLYILIRYPDEAYAQYRFDKMRRKYLRMTPRIGSKEGLMELRADCFMTGSDQVWGPMMNGHYDPAYFLDFVKEGKKVSYAGSFGKTHFNDATVSAYKQMLAKYNKISVREDSAVKMLTDWGLTNCIGQVLDPTLMPSGSEWRKFAWLKPASERGYVLVYQIHNDPKLSAYAKDLSKKLGFELIRVNPYLHQIMRGGNFICCPDVKEFLKLINECSIMVTDSFHGTCFAINFNKQFIEILPNNNTGTRNKSILSLTGLDNRILTDMNDYSLANQQIDFVPVNQLLDRERDLSLSILKDLLA